MSKSLTFLILILFSILLFSCNNEKHQEIDTTENIEKLIEQTDAEKAENLNEQGIKFIQNGNYDEARNKFQKAYNLDSNNVFILNSIGNLEQISGNYNLSIDYFKKAMFQDSSYSKTYTNIAMAFYLTEQYDSCIYFISKLEKLSDTEDILGISLFYKTKAYLQLNDCENANSTFIKTQDILINDPAMKTQIKDLLIEIAEKCK